MNARHRLIGFTLIVIAAIVGTWASLEIDWFPTLSAADDGKIDTLYDVLLICSVPVFVGVTAFIAFCLIEFRAKPDQGNDVDGPPIHGSTAIEVVWTIIPTIIVTVLAIYAWAVLKDVETKKDGELQVKVVGQQFAWRFEYPKEKVKSNELVVPIDRPIYFRITSDDVIHSFWVPSARMKRDAAAGVITPLRFTPTRLGRYAIVCAELCGIGHATMRQSMRVVSEADYEQWVKNGGGSGAPAAGGPDGKQIFNANGCGSCHVLTDAGGAGQVGPSLDKIGTKGAAFVKTGIIDPDADLAGGFKAGIMPKTFGDQLSPEELDALVKYLVKVGK